MKDYKFEFEIDNERYALVFNLNVMEAIQKQYGTVQKWGKLTDNKGGKEPNAKALIFGFTEMINEAIEIDNDEKDINKPLLNNCNWMQTARFFSARNSQIYFWHRINFFLNF